jgi:hypothetical protein
MANTSKVKTSKNLFLGKAEIDRIHDWLKEGKKLYDKGVYQYGIVKSWLNDTSALRISAGATPDKVSIESGSFTFYDTIAQEARLMTLPSAVVDVADVPTDSVTRQVYIRYVETTLEEGTCNLAATGQLTGTGTMFTEVLRGQPNFPATIKFEKTGLVNTSEYSVIQVLSDTDVWINNPTSAETGLKYKVVGTFVPDAVIPAADKEIFGYGSYEIVVSNLAVSDAIILADVVSDGTTLTVTDRRAAFHESEDFAYLTRFQGTNANQVIGVEFAKYGSQYSDLSKNLVKIGWGIRSNGSGTWAINHETMRLTIISGSGGIYDGVSSIPNFALYGWRVYFENSDKWVRVNANVGGILYLQEYDQTALPASGVGNIMVVPDCDKIQIRTSKRGSVADLMVESEKMFPIQDGYGLMEISPVGAKIEYSQHWVGNRSQYRVINDGDYNNETEFDADGVQIANTQSGSITGGNGEITLALSPSSFSVGGMQVNTANDMLAGGSIQHFNALITETGGVIQIPSTGVCNFGSSAISAGTVITGIANFGEGTLLTVFFANTVTLESSIGLQIFPVAGVQTVVAGGEHVTFIQVSSSGIWRMVSRSGVADVMNTTISINRLGGSSDRLNISVADTSSSANFSLIGSHLYSGISATVYFPQGSGMMARYNDGAGTPSELWNTEAITVAGDLSIDSSTTYALNSAGSTNTIKWKIIGKTLLMNIDLKIQSTGAGDINHLSVKLPNISEGVAGQMVSLITTNGYGFDPNFAQPAFGIIASGSVTKLKMFNTGDNTTVAKRLIGSSGDTCQFRGNVLIELQ